MFNFWQNKKILKKLLSFETKVPLHISSSVILHLVDARLIRKKIDFLSVICFQRIYSHLQKFRNRLTFSKLFLEMSVGLDDANNKV